VSASDKDTARGHVDESLSAGNLAMVRVNAVDTDWHEADLALVAEHGVPVMLAKAERAEDIGRIARLTPAPVIVPLVETTALTDMRPLVDDFAYARRLGMTAKLCLHPAQVAAVHAAAAPSADELQWAQRIIAACADDTSALAVDGQMVDAPVLERARRIAAAAQRC
jgi:citrate lyase beta subunit